MSFNYRKFFLILFFLLIVLVAGYGLYYAFFRGQEVTPPINANLGPGGVLPNIGNYENQPPYENVNAGLPTIEGAPGAVTEKKVDEVAQGGVTKVKALTTARVEGVNVRSDGSVAYYDPSESQFFRIGPDGKPEPLTDKLFYQVSQVNWAPNGERAILEYPDNSKIMYDFSTNKQVTLPKQWEDFSFDASSEQIAFKHMAQDTENRWLAVARANGDGAEAVEPLGENADKVQINWSPNSQVVATFWESMDAERQEVFFLGLHGENNKSMITHGRGFNSEWTPKGDKLLYSVYNSASGFRPTLWSVNAKGDNIGTSRQDLNVETWVDKCAISRDNENTYCAVPSSLPEGAGLYPRIADNIPDYFYKINLRTGVKSIIAQPDGSYTAESVYLSPDEDYLYFVDINTGQVNQVRLK